MEIHLLDDHLLRCTDAVVDFLPFPAGPRTRALMRALGVSGLRWRPRAHPHDCGERGLHALEGDDAEALLALVSCEQSEWHVVSVAPSSQEDALWDCCRGAASAHRCEPGTMSFAGHQPGYLPHLSFFAKMQAVDVFTFADDLQFVRREWHNRQRIPADNRDHWRWLTVPVRRGARLEAIGEKTIGVGSQSSDWRSEHWQAIRRAYGATPFFDCYAPFLETIYARRWRTLNALNEALTRYLAHALGTTPPVLIRASEVPFSPGLRKGERIAAEIVAIAARIGARVRRVVYVAGCGAAYLNQARKDGKRERDFLTESRIFICSCSMDDAVLREASQGLDARSPAVTFLFNLGPRAGDVLRAALSVHDDADT
jgi:hypothetical protein